MERRPYAKPDLDNEKLRLGSALLEMQRLGAPYTAWVPVRAVAEAQVETLYWTTALCQGEFTEGV